ncbi:hypothetical protein NLU13_5525 [Sarocladium strictum]|uniref:F-box domain-containing protein n=1 Tax=Sarocladium strictum TaxID=5046 RepID=A0AA39L7Q5_SARSR|nr:hypothetical protein NLU13_5525 [Sarocladium strictum]
MADNTSSHILQLPGEILTDIVLLSAPFSSSTGFYHWLSLRKDTTALALPLVCRRFHEIATPFLYQDLELDLGDGLPSERLRSKIFCLHRTLDKNPDLRRHCRALFIDAVVTWTSEDLWSKHAASAAALRECVEDMARWLADLTCFWMSIEVNGIRLFHFDTASIVRQVLVNNARLEKLTIQDTVTAAVPLPTILDTLSTSGPEACLSTLVLAGLSDSQSAEIWTQLQPGTASITELTLKHCLLRSTCLEALVRWPKKLLKFDFSMPSSQYYAGEPAATPYTLAVLHPILSWQKDSLLSIAIRELLNGGGIRGFDLANFTALRNLWLTHALTGTDTASISSLVAPGLRVLQWDLTREHPENSETLDSFQEAEETWLRAFIAAAVDRGCKLDHVNIIFSPEWFSDGGGEEMKRKYPWDRMDEIARDARQHGITLSYNPPNITKEQFESELDSHRQFLQRLE